MRLSWNDDLASLVDKIGNGNFATQTFRHQIKLNTFFERWKLSNSKKVVRICSTVRPMP